MSEQDKKLLKLFYLDKLKQAAECDDAMSLKLVREIIGQIKQSQLEHLHVANTEMVLKVLQGLCDSKKAEYDYMLQQLDDARAYMTKVD